MANISSNKGPFINKSYFFGGRGSNSVQSCKTALQEAILSGREKRGRKNFDEKRIEMRRKEGGRKEKKKEKEGKMNRKGRKKGEKR